jgi:hypothetical protein
MRFLNTGVEFNILKTFPNLKKAEEYYSRVFGMKVDLDKNGYKKDDQRKILLSRIPAKLLSAEANSRNYLSNDKAQVGLSGIIDTVLIETVTMSYVLGKIKHISSPLRQDYTTFVKSIRIIINKIDQKLLTFEQVKTRLIARYGKHTVTRKGALKVIDWKTGQYKPSNEFIWEDNEAFLLLGISSMPNDKDFVEMQAQKILMILKGYNEWEGTTADINILLQNNSSILKIFYAQAYKIAELEELVIEKKTNLENLNF